MSMVTLSSTICTLSSSPASTMIRALLALPLMTYTPAEVMLRSLLSDTVRLCASEVSAVCVRSLSVNISLAFITPVEVTLAVVMV